MPLIYFTGHDNRGRPSPERASGEISFLPETIILTRATDGAVLRLSYKIDFGPKLDLSITSLTAEVHVAAGSLLRTVGIAVDPQCYVIDTGYEFPGGMISSTIHGELRLPLSLAAIENIERLRAGGRPEFAVTMHGCVFVRDDKSKPYDTARLQIDGSSNIPVRFQIDRDVWAQQVRNVSPMGSVLVEIPLAVTRQSPWDHVWKLLDEASASLSQGGELGWRNCVSSVRQALDAWRSFEPFTTAKDKQRTQKNDRERLLDMASDLFNYCSLAIHTDEHRTDWTRAEAVLALSGLCSLLAVRNP